MGIILNFSGNKIKSVFLLIFCLFFTNFLSFAQNSLAVENSSSQSEQNLQNFQISSQNSALDESQILLNQEQKSEENIPLDFTRQNSSESKGAGGIWIFIRMILVLALIVFLIWFIFKMMKKSVDGKNESDPFLRKTASISLGAGKSVVIVTLIDKAYLLGVSENSVNLITEITDEQMINALNLYADKTQNSERAKSFDEVLKMFMGRKNAQNQDTSNTKQKKSGFMDFFNAMRGTPNTKKYELDEETASLINSLKKKRLDSGSKKTTSAAKKSEKSENKSDEN